MDIFMVLVLIVIDDAIAIDDTDIHKYLMKKNNIIQNISAY